MDVVALIRAVKARCPLWDRKHAFYHDRIVTMGMWNDVAASLGTDPDSARAKWKGLRDTFRGELKKVNKTIANGTPCNSTNWEYFEEMVFVKDQIYSNKRNWVELLQKPNMLNTNLLSSVKTEEANDNSEDTTVASELCKTQVTTDDEDHEPQVKLECRDSPTNSTSSLNLIEHQAPPPPPLPNLVHQHHPHILPTDDDYNFLMSVLPQLRSLPTIRNLYVRLKIQELLYSEIIALQEQ